MMVGDLPEGWTEVDGTVIDSDGCHIEHNGPSCPDCESEEPHSRCGPGPSNGFSNTPQRCARLGTSCPIKHRIYLRIQAKF